MATSPRARSALVLTAAVAGGLAAGFLAERRVVHRRLAARRRDAPLGSLAGELVVIDGPDGMQVATESYGPVDAPQLLLAHGWVCTGRVWHEQVLALADTYRVITYDQPGHGRTSRPASGSYSLDLLGDTLRTVIEQVARPGPLVVAGHSMGGMTLLNAARRHDDLLDERVAGVVLVSTTSDAQPTRRLSFDASIQAFARLDAAVRRLTPRLRDPRVIDLADRATASTSDLSHLLTSWVSTGPGAAPDVIDFTQQMALESGSEVVIGLAEAILDVHEDAGLDHLLLRGTPVSIVVGGQDRLTPTGLSQRMADRVGAELVIVDDIGHMLPLEAPDALNAVLRRHLERVAGTVSVA